MKYCEECGAILLSSAEKCPNCGHNVDDYNVDENLGGTKIDVSEDRQGENRISNQPNVYLPPQNYNQQRLSNYNSEKFTFMPLVFAILSLLSGIVTVIFFSKLFLPNLTHYGIMDSTSFTYFTLATSIIALITGSKALKEKDQTSKTLAVVAISIAIAILSAYVIIGFILVGRLIGRNV